MDNKFIGIFVSALLIVILGTLLFVFNYNMLPVMIQSQNDFVNPNVSGVNLTTQQSNLAISMGNIGLLVMLVVPIIAVIVGFIVMIWSGFKAFGGKD